MFHLIRGRNSISCIEFLYSNLFEKIEIILCAIDFYKNKGYYFIVRVY